MAFPTEESFIESDEWQLFPVRDESDRKRLSRTANDVVRETEAARQWRAFPADAVAIASAGTGDLLVFPAGSGEVHLWNYETGRALPHPVH